MYVYWQMHVFMCVQVYIYMCHCEGYNFQAVISLISMRQVTRNREWGLEQGIIYIITQIDLPNFKTACVRQETLFQYTACCHNNRLLFMHGAWLRIRSPLQLFHSILFQLLPTSQPRYNAFGKIETIIFFKTFTNL